MSSELAIPVGSVDMENIESGGDKPLPFSVGKVVSIVIRCRNAAEDLEQCLKQIALQLLPVGTRLEVVVVDNESTDSTAEVAHRHGATVVPLATDEFSWGRALNLGIAKCSGDPILLLSADAHPIDSNWLVQMLKPFADESVGAVYGRQLPRPDAPIDERARLARMFGDRPHFRRLNETDGPPAVRVTASNACAAIRRSRWRELPFDEDCTGGEERIWSAAVLERGHAIVYQPLACVNHSHRDRLGRQAWREFELYENFLELTHQKATIIACFMRSAAIVKRRLKNCIQVEAPARPKLMGVIRLPAEVVLFLILSLSLRGRGVRSAVRRALW
jgi:glycosyltransferase involved in cell wall biosynthesis